MSEGSNSSNETKKEKMFGGGYNFLGLIYFVKVVVHSLLTFEKLHCKGGPYWPSG